MAGSGLAVEGSGVLLLRAHTTRTINKLTFITQHHTALLGEAEQSSVVPSPVCCDQNNVLKEH